MGKIRTRTLGLEEVEKKEKEEQNEEKKETKKAVKSKKSTTVTQKKRGKKYVAAKSSLDKALNRKPTSITEALKLLKQIKYAGFDESIELHMNVVKEGLKGELNFPHSIGKKIRVAIVDDKVIEKIDEGKIDFDILISHPSFMPKLARYAKVLGPRGLMPSPKVGTITDKPEVVAKKFEGGLVRWKTEVKAPLIHQLIGKASLDDKMITENVKVFINAVGRPNIQAIFIKSTMSPSIQLDIETI